MVLRDIIPTLDKKPLAYMVFAHVALRDVIPTSDNKAFSLYDLCPYGAKGCNPRTVILFPKL